MVDVKVSASFILPGRVLPAEPPCSEKGKKKKKRKEKENNEVLYRQEIIHLRKQKPIVIQLRKPLPAKQTLHLSSVAYNYMTAVDNPVEGMKVHDWRRLSSNKRLKYHLQAIAWSLNATLESFTVLND